jgi:aminopeptidase YwaD
MKETGSMKGMKVVHGSLLAALLLAGSCRSSLESEVRSLVQAIEAQDALQESHVGPPVELDETGPARFTSELYEAYRTSRAMELVSFIDRFYRAPANQGYDEVLTRLDKVLREAGYDGPERRLELGFLDVGMENAWTPVSAELKLLVDGEEPRILHGFEESTDEDRVMLPINAPSCHVTGEVALHLDDLKQGMILVTEVPANRVIARARSRGAAAVISASLYSFNEDPTGAKRHLDAIQFRSATVGDDMPVAQISPRSLQVIEAGLERAAKRGAKVRMTLEAEVVEERRPLRTLMARVVGSKHPEESVVMVSHVQEPGACDNASGVAGLVESAASLAGLLTSGKLPWPDRSLVFLWGDEFRQSDSWLATAGSMPVAAISSDMTGQSKETGAIALLERNPDPGALKVLPPDAHTPWGAGRVTREELMPNGLAVIARCAMADVNALEGGGWTTAEHPWEGGSDHDIFIRRKVPAILFWHFTDFAYHTSLDRMKFVDPDEMRRTAVALLSTGMAVASAAPGDLERYVQSLELERLVRVGAADDVSDPEMAELWEQWCKGTRGWLRNLCLGVEEPIPEIK